MAPGVVLLPAHTCDLYCLQALLRRLEHRLAARGVGKESCEILLRQLFPRTPANRPVARYPVKVFLVAYMIQEYPAMVFNTVVGSFSCPNRCNW